MIIILDGFLIVSCLPLNYNEIIVCKVSFSTAKRKQKSITIGYSNNCILTEVIYIF